MRYNVSAFINDTEYNYTVSCRWDAKTETLFKKCVSAVHRDLSKTGILPEKVRYSYDLPNVWRNGAIGALWIEKPFCNITVVRADGCCIAL